MSPLSIISIIFVPSIYILQFFDKLRYVPIKEERSYIKGDTLVIVIDQQITSQGIFILNNSKCTLSL